MGRNSKYLRRLSDALELPGEAFGAPKLLFSGRDSLLAENLRAVIHFSPELICVGTDDGNLRVLGTGLTISGLGCGRMLIRGSISSVEWE